MSLNPLSVSVTKPGRHKRPMVADSATVEPVESHTANAAKLLGESERAIRQRVARAKRQSPDLEEARKAKKISTSQADELIKLPAESQSLLIPHVVGKSVVETRTLVNIANKDGLEKAIAQSSPPPPLQQYTQDFVNDRSLTKSALQSRNSPLLACLSAFCSKANMILVEALHLFSPTDKDGMFLLDDLKSVQDHLTNLIEKVKSSQDRDHIAESSGICDESADIDSDQKGLEPAVSDGGIDENKGRDASSATDDVVVDSPAQSSIDSDGETVSNGIMGCSVSNESPISGASSDDEQQYPAKGGFS